MGSAHAWDYSSQGDNWALSGDSDYVEACAGDMQSPIDFDRAEVTEFSGMDNLTFSAMYCDLISGYFFNNGHTLQFNIDEDGDGTGDTPDATSSYITGGPLGDVKYYFWQFHFHWGYSGNSGVMGNILFSIKLHYFCATDQIFLMKKIINFLPINQINR